MTLETVIFYVSAAIAVLATLLVITRRNALHALLYLIVSLLGVAVMFFTLGAPLAAALEVIVYAGAIVVLIVFVVMMFNLQAERPGPGRSRARAWAGPAVLSAVLLAEFLAVVSRGGPHGLAPAPAPPRLVGLSLFSTYALGVELAAVLLLAAVVGAFHLGSRKSRPRHRLIKEAPE